MEDQHHFPDQHKVFLKNRFYFALLSVCESLPSFDCVTTWIQNSYWREQGVRLVYKPILLFRVQKKSDLKMGGVEKGKKIFIRKICAILWKGDASIRLGQISVVYLGERQVGPLDFLTGMPTRTKASRWERRRRWSIWRIPSPALE